jgi:preprotein translocase subunit YajC
MFISNAYAQAAGAAGPSGGILDQMMQSGLPMILAVVVIFYFLVFRPNQQARKAHAEMLAALKKGDMITTSGGLIGKVRSVAEDEVRVELAPNVEVRVARGAIAEVRGKTEPAPANDSKASAS